MSSVILDPSTVDLLPKEAKFCLQNNLLVISDKVGNTFLFPNCAARKSVRQLCPSFRTNGGMPICVQAETILKTMRPNGR